MPLSNINPARYEALLTEKTKQLVELLSPFQPPPPTVFASPPTGYRLRAEFRVWHEGDDLNYVMFKPGNPQSPIPVTEFVIAHELIQVQMWKLLPLLRSDTRLRHKLFQVEFLASLRGDVLVTLIYHRHLDKDWQQAAQHLRQQMSEDGPCDMDSLSIIGRSRKQKLTLGREYVRERLVIGGCEFNYRQYEQAFTQPNAAVNCDMIEWACMQARELDGDLLELYCGNGNFTLPLAQYFERVLATEVSKTSVRAALANRAANGCENVSVVRLSAEEVAQALRGVRPFRRLAALPLPLAEYDLRTMFVDPPRAGLDDLTLELAGQFRQVLYISCNPQSLVDNLRRLSLSHEITKLALFDQFPYTDHTECGVFLQQREP